MILGTPGNPTVSDPGPLRGQRGDRVTWHIDNRTGGEVDVWIKNFKRKGTATKDDPLQGPEADRRKNSNGPTPVSISDVIKGSPAARQFKYDVHLNGQEALDPDLEVMN